ncbi:MAG TPA: hypothetical protein VEQ66_05305 [Propionibacteriaceae bacterium]|nr:hypothetical protein [Propionibacteriaceae bacterium]
MSTYLGGGAVFVARDLAVTRIVAPEDLGWSELGGTGTTVALLAAVVLSTPMQAAGEELMFRGAILPAAASGGARDGRHQRGAEGGSLGDTPGGRSLPPASCWAAAAGAGAGWPRMSCCTVGSRSNET